MADEIPRVEITVDECKGCQFCISDCPKDVITLSKDFNKLGYQYAIYAGEGCNGCGACYYTCPEPGAIVVYKKPKKSKSKAS